MLKKCQIKHMIHVCLTGKKVRIFERHVMKKGKKVESTFAQHYELRNFAAIFPV